LRGRHANGFIRPSDSLGAADRGRDRWRLAPVRAHGDQTRI